METLDDKYADLRLELRELNSAIKILYGLFLNNDHIELSNMEDLVSILEEKSQQILEKYDYILDKFTENNG